MSGGFFDYQDYRLEEMAKLLRLEIAKCRQKPDWTTDWSNYSDNFIAEMSKAYNQLMELRVRLHRLDWVLRGDDGEDDYFQLLLEDLPRIEFDDSNKDDSWLAKEKEQIEKYEKERDPWR